MTLFDLRESYSRELSEYQRRYEEFRLAVAEMIIGMLRDEGRELSRWADDGGRIDA